MSKQMNEQEQRSLNAPIGAGKSIRRCSVAATWVGGGSLGKSQEVSCWVRNRRRRWSSREEGTARAEVAGTSEGQGGRTAGTESGCGWGCGRTQGQGGEEGRADRGGPRRSVLFQRAARRRGQFLAGERHKSFIRQLGGLTLHVTLEKMRRTVVRPALRPLPGSTLSITPTTDVSL